jgi:cyanophycinase
MDYNATVVSRAGYLMPIGGAEDRTVRSPLLNQFVKYAGGATARIIVIPTASGFAAEVGADYCTLFRHLGVADVSCLHVLDRREANDPHHLSDIERATGIFLTGGDQVKLVSMLGGTALEAAIAASHKRGSIVAGTSAGASALSRQMIAFGRSGVLPSRRMVQLTTGLGLLDRVIVDQHFRQRNRIGRLITAVAFNPSSVGVGIDEDTAFVVDPHYNCHVLGSGSVTVVDGRDMQEMNFSSMKSHQPLTVTGIKVHNLRAGSQYNLNSLELQ